MRAAVVALAGACVVLGVVPGLLVASLARSGPVAGVDAHNARAASTRHGIVADGRDRGRARPARSDVLRVARKARRRAGADMGRAASSCSRSSRGRAPDSRSRCASCSKRCCAREREIAVRTSGGVVQEVSYSGRVPHLIDERLYAPIVRSALVAARHARRLQTGRLGTYVGYLIALVLVLLAAAKAGPRSDERRLHLPRRAVRRLAARAAPARAHPALEGAAAGTARPVTAAAVSRTATSVGEERGRSCRLGRCLPLGARCCGVERRRCRAARTGCRSRAGSRRRSRHARPRRPARARALRGRRCFVGRCERVFAHGREPRPDDCRVDRGDARARACGRRTRCRDDEPHRHGRRNRGHGGLVEPGARARRRRVRPGRRRRDGAAADRQPRHASGADDDPRGAAARVRGSRPRVSAMGCRRAALARAGARRADLPAACARASGYSSALSRSRSSSSAARLH